MYCPFIFFDVIIKYVDVAILTGLSLQDLYKCKCVTKGGASPFRHTLSLLCLSLLYKSDRSFYECVKRRTFQHAVL